MSIANSSKIVTFQANRELVNDAMEVLKEKISLFHQHSDYF